MRREQLHSKVLTLIQSRLSVSIGSIPEHPAVKPDIISRLNLCAGPSARRKSRLN